MRRGWGQEKEEAAEAEAERGAPGAGGDAQLIEDGETTIRPRQTWRSGRRPAGRTWALGAGTRGGAAAGQQ